MKRNLLIATVLTFCLSLAFALVMVNPVGANAATATVNKVSAFEYKLSYLVEDAGFSYQSSMTATIDGVAVVTPSTEEGGTTEEQQTAAGFKTTNGTTVEFLAKKEYTLAVTNADGSESYEITVDTTATPSDTDLAYAYTPEQLEEYVNLVNEATNISEDGTDATRPIRVDDDFTVPSVADLVNDKYFDVNDLKGTLYYAAPGSSSFSTKSISDLDVVNFEVSKVGTYSFYVLLRNDLVAMTTTDLVLGVGGWYEKDDNGDATGDVIIPVFTFTVGASSSPKVTVGTSEKAYQGLEYTVNCFNIVASDYNTEYTLYYSETKIAAEDITSYDKSSLEALGMKEVTTENGFEEANLFDSSDRTFTPLEKGYYYVVLHVVDFANEHTTTISRVIDATSELRQVNYETQFLRYNWVSVVLLSVAVLCFVAIIVLLCVKPKEKNTLVTKQ